MQKNHFPSKHRANAAFRSRLPMLAVTAIGQTKRVSERCPGRDRLAVDDFRLELRPRKRLHRRVIEKAGRLGIQHPGVAGSAVFADREFQSHVTLDGLK